MTHSEFGIMTQRFKKANCLKDRIYRARMIVCGEKNSGDIVIYRDKEPDLIFSLTIKADEEEIFELLIEALRKYIDKMKEELEAL